MNMKELKLPYEIIDFHTHPFCDVSENICSHAGYCDMSEENILRDMKAGGITKFCGAVIVRKPATDTYSQWDNIVACNRSAYQCYEDFGGCYIPGIMVHPDYVEESKAEIDRWYDKGIRLVGELVPYCHGWKDYSCDGFSKILDYITEKNMIVSLHSMGEDEMDSMVERHPDTKFVFAHPGEYGAFMRHLSRMKKSDNCYLDLSGTGMFRHGMLRHAIDEVGVDKILFGSDYPTCNPYMFVGGVYFDALLTDAEKKAIFADNVRNLFAKVGLSI